LTIDPSAVAVYCVDEMKMNTAYLASRFLSKRSVVHSEKRCKPKVRSGVEYGSLFSGAHGFFVQPAAAEFPRGNWRS
jgi:hypothetical protein